MKTYKALIIGDSHIPRRAKEIPEPILDKINKIAEEEPFDYTFFTGDLVNYDEFIEFLSSNTKRDLFIVMGNMDYYSGNKDAPLYQELELNIEKEGNNNLLLGLTHGSQIQDRGNHSQLEKLAQEKGYNVLISGHTHQEEITLRPNGILLLNPGSVTGAWSFIASKVPAFIILTINTQNGRLKIILYQLDTKSRQLNSKTYYFNYITNKIQEES